MDGEEVVRRYDAPHEAQLDASYLREHGLHPRIDNDVLVGMNPLWGQALGGIRLYVPEAQAREAATLLDALHRSLASGVDAAASSSEAPDDAPSRSRTTLEADAEALRARNAAVVGLLLFPGIAHLYSVWLLVRLNRDHLSEHGLRHRRVAWIVNSIVLGVAAWVVFW